MIAALLAFLLAAPWLAASDLHLNPFDASAAPSPYGRDANAALVRAAVAEMKRAEPNPAVVVIAGDFFVHKFAQRAGRAHGPGNLDRAGVDTMREIANAFGRAFPKAQFAIALGNNDAPCGDYHSADGSAYLASVARIWAPLVNRNGAAPDFRSSFARGGYYSGALPLHEVRLIVLNTVPFSRNYRGNCPSAASAAASAQLAWLAATLRRNRATSRTIVLMHIPPGFDPFSTAFAHGFVAWPFLETPYATRLSALLADPANRVTLAIAGHAHRLDYRLAGEVPILVLGAISPIYDNNPAFYTLRLAADGSLRDFDTHVFDEPTQTWRDHPSFDATWGVARVDGASLQRLHGRLESDPALRRRWDEQAAGWPSDGVVQLGTWGRWWRASWCAQTTLTQGFAQCAGIEPRIEFVRLLAPAAALAAALLVLAAFARLCRLRKKSRTDRFGRKEGGREETAREHTRGGL